MQNESWRIPSLLPSVSSVTRDFRGTFQYEFLQASNVSTIRHETLPKSTEWVLSILRFLGISRYKKIELEFVPRDTEESEYTHVSPTRHQPPPKSTESRYSDSSVTRGTNSSSILFRFEFVPRNLILAIRWIWGVYQFQWNIY